MSRLCSNCYRSSKDNPKLIVKKNLILILALCNGHPCTIQELSIVEEIQARKYSAVHFLIRKEYIIINIPLFKIKHFN